MTKASVRRISLVAAAVAAALAIPVVAQAKGATPPAAPSSAQTYTKDVTRTFDNGDSVETVDQRTIKVDIDKTENLRGRQRVHITWSGARPTAGRSVNPFGDGASKPSDPPRALQQEYPVVIMQCRGSEGAGLSPETCWTSTFAQRSQVGVSDPTEALWRQDADAAASDREPVSGVLDPQACPDATESTHLTPFIAAKGSKPFPACSATTMPPEAAVGSSFPPAEMSAFTNTSGTGDVYFEVRSDVENESLGCNDQTACSIVVIPIEGLSCLPKGTEMYAARACRKEGVQQPGTMYDSSLGSDAAVTSRYWWSASNWKNRITIPITFGPPPNVCNLLDSRSPVGFFGSELMSQTALQWAPAYCLNQKRFKFQANKMPDDAAFGLLGTGEAAAAFVSAKHESTDPIGYAPTAITGFGVGYVIDKPNNAGEVTDLRLNARLIAKLLTNSYTGRQAGSEHPGMTNNPMRINLDPEFKALNPDISQDLDPDIGASLMSLSVASDVMDSLTSYIKRDPEAHAFLNGNPDPWGMLVNPAYKGINLPVSDWPLNDDWRIPSGSDCGKANTTPYATQLAAPVGSMRTIAEALLDGWPLVQTKVDSVPDANSASGFLCKYGRIDRLDIGHRFILGVIDLGDAERLGLRTAALQTSAKNSGASFTGPQGRTFAAASSKSMSDALLAYGPAKCRVAPFVFDPKAMKATAYPGTMIVYTAARLRGLEKSQAKNVASFVRISSSEGQRPGSGNGQLAAGYLPMKKGGATAALWTRAQLVADRIQHQRGGCLTADDTAAAPAAEKTKAPKAEKAAAPAAAPAANDAKPESADRAAKTTFIETDPTAVKTSTTAAVVLPLLLLGAAVSMLATPIVRMMLVPRDGE